MFFPQLKQSYFNHVIKMRRLLKKHLTTESHSISHLLDLDVMKTPAIINDTRFHYTFHVDTRLACANSKALMYEKAAFSLLC